MVLLNPRTELDPPITMREENAWARALRDRDRGIRAAAIGNGLVEWVRMQRWIKVYGKHPRVVRWLEKHPPPALWQESPEAYAFVGMPFAPGWWKMRKGGA